MSVIDFVNRSVCLYCTSVGGVNDFHDVFEDAELQLPNLIKKYFGLVVTENADRKTKQYLCVDCVNHLIELYDLEEHNKEVQLEREDDDNGTADNIEIEIETEKQIVIDGVSNQIKNDEVKYLDSASSYRDDNDECSGEAEDETAYNEYMESTEIYFCADGEEETSELIYSHEDVEANSCDLNDNIQSVADFEQNIATDYVLETKSIEHSNKEEYVELITFKDDIEIQTIEDTNLDFEEEVNPVDIVEDNEAYEDLELPSSTSLNDDFIEEDEEYFSADISCMHDSVEEEHLIEETICSQEYDNVNLNDYLDKAIITKFEDLQLKWTVECKLCLYKHYSFQELIKHPCVNELVGDQQSCCIIQDCNDVVNNLKTLARHLIIQHYEKVDSLAVYGRCPECQKTFSNLIDFNKHSCCNLKRTPGTRNYCPTCDIDFQSFRRFVFHMQFHLIKHRPKICLLCGAMFHSPNDFFEHVHYSHTVTNLACRMCDRFFQDKTVFEQHMASHESKSIFECTQCPKRYTNKSGLTNHMDIYHNHKMKALQCEYCYKEFINQTTYRNHMKFHLPEGKATAFICTECGLVSHNKNLIEEHVGSEETDGNVVKKVLSIVFTCEHCSLDFESTKHLRNHRRSPKHDGKLFYCPICRKDFKTFKHMRNHLSCHRDYDEWFQEFPIDRMYMCDIGNCLDAYPLWTSLYYHKKRHKSSNDTAAAAPASLNCQFCKKKCPTKMSLAIHVARSHNSNHIKCPHCKKMYKSDLDLKLHIEYMHLAVECSQCSKMFKNQRNLISHEQLVHKNAKRFYCSHCSKGYYYKSELNAHERNAHPDVLYQCKLCNFKTTYPKSLDIHHMAKHEHTLPFKCSQCSKGFARKQLLVTHMKRHKEDKDFICKEYLNNGCNASFVTYFLMKEHIDTQHPSTSNGRSLLKKSTQQRVILYNEEEDDTSEVEYLLGDSVEEEPDSDNEYEIEDINMDDECGIADELDGECEDDDTDF
uniref:C2H2-type domain-containing protein n=1 Tax=Stomoxys calcitrans TaxID=35570 RepID=A0A1I8NPP8_STOCA